MPKRLAAEAVPNVPPPPAGSVLAAHGTTMPRGSALTLTDGATLGLFFIQRYRFLTIDQFARAAELKRSTASDQLRMLERHGLLGHFGNTGLAGHGKTPKAYFLTRKGWEILSRESDIPPELIGTHKEIHVEARWSPQMYHRLHTVDLMISAEVAVRARPQLSMVRTFIEYRRMKRGAHIARETTDYVAAEETTENRIVPDAAFVMENIESKKRGLFFVEMDMATERIVSRITRDDRDHAAPQNLAVRPLPAEPALHADLRALRRVPLLHPLVRDAWRGARRECPPRDARPAGGTRRLLPLHHLRAGHGRLLGADLEKPLAF